MQIIILGMIVYSKLKSQPEEILPIFIQGAIYQSLNQVFGEIGGQTDFELLSFDENRLRGVIKVAYKYTVKTRAALTLISKFQGTPAIFQVNKVANCLPYLASSFLEV
jgi:RNase P/RNase MRP subunit POP5